MADDRNTSETLQNALAFAAVIGLIYALISLHVKTVRLLWRPYSTRNPSSQFFGCCGIILMALSYMLFITNVFSETHDSGGYVTVIVQKANIREAPAKTAKVIKTAANGEKLTALGIRDNWYEITVNNDKKGFISKSIVSYTKTKTPTQKNDDTQSAFTSLLAGFSLYIVGFFVKE